MYSVHGKICTLLKLHFRRYPLGNRSERNWADTVLLIRDNMSVQKKKKKTTRVQLRKPKNSSFFLFSFRKASATFIGRLSLSRHAGRTMDEESTRRFSWFFSFFFLYTLTTKRPKAQPPSSPSSSEEEERGTPSFMGDGPVFYMCCIYSDHQKKWCWFKNVRVLAERPFQHCKRFTVK